MPAHGPGQRRRAWAEKSGAAIFANVPADKLNDDRLGRALDAFFEQRHSILGSVTAQASLERLHFDPTNLLLCGAYRTSTPRPDWQELPPALGLDGEATPTFPGDRLLPPAHLCHGYSDDRKMMQIGQLAVVDDYGALPVLAHCLDGNQNGHPAIHETFLLAQQHLALPDHMFLISDRGTHSLEHLVRLHNAGYSALCPGQWKDYRAIYDANFHKLDWQPASFLSLEQQRRRLKNQTCPTNTMRSPCCVTSSSIPPPRRRSAARLLFVYSSRRM